MQCASEEPAVKGFTAWVLQGENAAEGGVTSHAHAVPLTRTGEHIFVGLPDHARYAIALDNHGMTKGSAKVFIDGKLMAWAHLPPGEREVVRCNWEHKDKPELIFVRETSSQAQAVGTTPGAHTNGLITIEVEMEKPPAKKSADEFDTTGHVYRGAPTRGMQYVNYGGASYPELGLVDSYGEPEGKKTRAAVSFSFGAAPTPPVPAPAAATAELPVGHRGVTVHGAATNLKITTYTGTYYNTVKGVLKFRLFCLAPAKAAVVPPDPPMVAEPAS